MVGDLHANKEARGAGAVFAVMLEPSNWSADLEGVKDCETILHP